MRGAGTSAGPRSRAQLGRFALVTQGPSGHSGGVLGGVPRATRALIRESSHSEGQPGSARLSALGQPQWPGTPAQLPTGKASPAVWGISAAAHPELIGTPSGWGHRRDRLPRARFEHIEPRRTPGSLPPPLVGAEIAVFDDFGSKTRKKCTKNVVPTGPIFGVLLDPLRRPKPPISALGRRWEGVSRGVNYFPVFGQK